MTTKRSPVRLRSIERKATIPNAIYTDGQIARLVYLMALLEFVELDDDGLHEAVDKESDMIIADHTDDEAQIERVESMLSNSRNRRRYQSELAQMINDRIDAEDLLARRRAIVAKARDKAERSKRKAKHR